MENDTRHKFEMLVKQYKGTVYSVCYLFSESKEVADDLFQEVLINLWTGFDKFRGESSLSSWIYKVSFNTCISYKRKKRVETVPLDLPEKFFSTDCAEGRQSALLRSRIAKLEPFDKAIVLLWLEDLSYEEIAAITGLSSKAIGVRLVRIKEKLKSL